MTGLRFDARNYRQPDVVLYRREAAARDLLLPSDVVLAVSGLRGRREARRPGGAGRAGAAGVRLVDLLA